MNDKNKIQQTDLEAEDQTLEDSKGGMSEATTDIEADVDTDLGDLEARNYDQGPSSEATTTDEK